VPAIYLYRDFPLAGGLMSYGSDILDSYRLAGVQVARVLKGENPAELPVVQATKFELVINLTTAKALGINVPPSMQARADEMIESRADVRYWPKADIPSCTAHVRFRG
jgi:putative ABC transport system substrate-binding protein